MTNLVWSAQKRGKRRKRWNVLEHTRIPTRQLELNIMGCAPRVQANSSAAQLLEHPGRDCVVK